MGGQAETRSQGKLMRQEIPRKSFDSQLIDFARLVVKSFSIRISPYHYVCAPLNLTFEQLGEPTREILRVAERWDACMNRWIDTENKSLEEGIR
jgi:hypothetical protein